MKVVIKLHTLGKVQRPWKDSNGVERMSCSVNIMQEQGQVIDTLKLNQEQYNMIAANKPYTVVAEYGISKNGPFLRVIDIVADKA